MFAVGKSTEVGVGGGGGGVHFFPAPVAMCQGVYLFKSVYE